MARQARRTRRTSAAGGAPSSASHQHRVRIRIVMWCLLAGLGCIVGKLVQLQVDPDLNFSDEDLRHIAFTEIRIPRGEILDTNGIVLARDRRAPSLSAQPYKIEDAAATALRLSVLLDLDESEVLERLQRRDAQGRRMRFVWLKRWLSDEELAHLTKLEPALRAGLTIEYEPVRHYPQGETAAHVLGFANRELKGAEGLELVYDEFLRSLPGRRVARVDARRNLLDSLKLEHTDPHGGDSIYLTLDVALQHRLEQELDKALEGAKAEQAMGILMDPMTGAILALACRPAFDPNEFYRTEAEERKNRAIVDVFEPGSVFKVVTASAALEMGLVTPSTLIDCEGGRFNPYGHTIRDYYARNVEPFSTCYALSSNIAMIKVAAQLGEDRLAQWIQRFGFGQSTSPDLRGESRGIVHPVNRWSRLSMGSLPMGQEISVTMPQLAQAFAVIANGGFLVRPYLVDRAVSPDGQLTYQYAGGDADRIISPQTAAIMKELSYLVVTEGTGKRAQIPEYRVGGKTGTAQIAPYHLNQYNAVFAGFAPLHNPKVVGIIVIHKPGVWPRSGGQLCAPVFREVVRDYLFRINYPLDPMDALSPIGGEVEQDADTVMAELRTTAPPVEQDSGLDSLKLVSHTADHTPVVQEGPVLPDLTGLTKQQVIARLTQLGCPWDMEGYGRVVEQDPPPGVPLEEVALCRLVFKISPREAGSEVRVSNR